MLADSLAECLIVRHLGVVERLHVEVDEPAALLLGDLQMAMHGNEVRETHLASKAIRSAEGLCRESGQLIDVLGAAIAEQRLQERVDEDTGVERLFEAMQRRLSPACSKSVVIAAR